MKRMYFFRNTLVLLWGVLAAPAVLHAQAPVGTAFTYQGQLKQAGEPLDDTADFEFTLWDAETGGAQVGLMVPIDNWLIEGGLFTVLLDFGEGVFTGDARWLEIAVRSPAGGGDFTTLTPRQELTAAPYALYALSGPGSGGFWAADGDDIYNTNSGNVGIGTPSPGYRLHVESDSARTMYVRNTAAGGTALQVSAAGTGPGGYGLDAYIATAGGRAVYAFNEAESGTAYAVYGENVSPDGVAIFGLADNGDQNSTGIGVYGRTDSEDGAGVYGEATHTIGSAYGVRGVSDHGTGVQGELQDTGNFGALGRWFEGVYGESAYGLSGIGVHGKWTGSSPGWGFGGAFTTTSELAAGVLAINEATVPGGSGVIGIHEHTSGEGYGVRGETASNDGQGVRGYNQASGNYGILGSGEYGVEGHGDAAGGYFADSDNSGEAYVGYGIRGIEAKGGEAGGYFEDSDDSGYAYVGSGHFGIRAYGNSGGGRFEDANQGTLVYVADGLYGISAYGPATGGYFSTLDGSGYVHAGDGERGIYAAGDDGGGGFYDRDNGTWAYVADYTSKIYSNGSCDFVQNHPDDPEKVVVYAAPEGDEVATYTRGTARLQNGVARVSLGETFKWVTNPDIGLTAHLTLRGDCPGIFVKSLTTEEVVVQEVGGGTSDVAFDYLVYGLRIGFEEVAVVQEKTVEAYIPSMADHRALYERRPELRDYNALERFKRMRADIGETEPLDLSAAQALHDAIIEFDPVVHSLDDRRELEAPESIEIGEDRSREQRPRQPYLVDPKDTELAELRARVEALEALVARLAAPQNGGEQ